MWGRMSIKCSLDGVPRIEPASDSKQVSCISCKYHVAKLSELWCIS